LNTLVRAFRDHQCVCLLGICHVALHALRSVFGFTLVVLMVVTIMKTTRQRLPRRMVGLDVSDTHLAAAQLFFGRDDSIRLEAAGWATPPFGADIHQMAEAVRQLFRKAGLSCNAVCTAFQSPSLVVKHFRHAHLSETELTHALAIEAEETLQLTSSEFYMDWHSNTDPSLEEPIDGVLVAMPRNEVDRHLQMLAMADIFPRIVDAGCLAVCNLYLQLKGCAAPDQAVAVVSLSQNRADIAILSGKHQIFPRSVFSPQATWDETPAYLAECVSDTIKYHRFMLHGPPVEHMVLTGAVPQREQVVSHLRELVPLMAFWDPISDLPSVKERLRQRLDRDIGASLATSLGLALRRDCA
jgi:hypothetical protein